MNFAKILPLFFLFITGLSLALSFVFGIYGAQKKVVGKENSYVLSFPKKLLAVAAVIEIAGLAANYFIKTSLEGEDPQFILIMSAVLLFIFAVVFIYICLKVNRCKIIVNGDKIIVVPTFGAKFTTSFGEIVSAKRKSSGSAENIESLIIKTRDGHKFKAVSTMYSYDIFEKKVNGSAESIVG